MLANMEQGTERAPAPLVYGTVHESWEEAGEFNYMRAYNRLHTGVNNAANPQSTSPESVLPVHTNSESNGGP